MGLGRLKVEFGPGEQKTIKQTERRQIHQTNKTDSAQVNTAGMDGAHHKGKQELDWADVQQEKPRAQYYYLLMLLVILITKNVNTTIIHTTSILLLLILLIILLVIL